MRLLVIILLAASIWTVAAKEVVVAEVIDAPSIQELYLFDISTRSSQPGTLKQAFWDVDVIVHNSLKVTGKRRHLFIVEDSGTLRDVNLPEDADVTVYPVEHLSDYMTLFDTEFGNPELGPLPDENLTLVERTWFAEGLSLSQYRAVMREHANNVIKIHDAKPAHIYVAIGYLPQKMFFFTNFNACGISRLFLDSNDVNGGPSTVNVAVSRIHNI